MTWPSLSTPARLRHPTARAPTARAASCRHGQHAARPASDDRAVPDIGRGPIIGGPTRVRLAPPPPPRLTPDATRVCHLPGFYKPAHPPARPRRSTCLGLRVSLPGLSRGECATGNNPMATDMAIFFCDPTLLGHAARRNTNVLCGSTPQVHRPSVYSIEDLAGSPPSSTPAPQTASVQEAVDRSPSFWGFFLRCVDRLDPRSPRRIPV